MRIAQIGRHSSISPVAIAASLLMEQVLAPRFEFKPKNPASGPVEGFDYGEGGYDPNKCNVGFNEETGRFQIEIKGLAEPKSKEAARICQEDLNEVIAAFVQDKTAIERGTKRKVASGPSATACPLASKGGHNFTFAK